MLRCIAGLLGLSVASDDSATDVAAGLLTLICLITGVIQLGVVIVLIPVVIYLFSTAETSTAIGFLTISSSQSCWAAGWTFQRLSFLWAPWAASSAQESSAYF